MDLISESHLNFFRFGLEFVLTFKSLSLKAKRFIGGGKLRAQPSVRIMKFLVLTTLIIIMLRFINCGIVHSPTAQKTQGSSFNHQGITTNCASCHDVGKSSDGYKGISGTVTNQMLHTVSGLPDCAACHFSSSQSNGFTSWNCENIPSNSMTIPTKGTFHSSVSPTSCVACHSGIAPLTATTDASGNAVPAHTSAFLGTSDCISCHATGIGLDWTKGPATQHTATQTNCASCHATGGADPTQYNAISNVVINQMLHTSSGLPDCFACHRANALANSFSSTSWKVEAVANNSIGPLSTIGIFHSKVNPTTCLNCHTGSRPTGPQGTPIAVDHAIAPANGDCVTCHTTNIGLNWLGAKFPHTPTPTSCANCHSKEMPAPGASFFPATPTSRSSPGAFNHAVIYGSECLSCHKVKTVNIGISWQSGYFDHPGNGITDTSTCTPCHIEHGQGPACFGCHSHHMPGGSYPTPSSSGNYGGNMN